jgi:hypothetical protein
MTADLPLRCSCGSLRGVASEVSPARGISLVCMCDDCQAYARWLGRAADILDEHGGTAVFQMTPAQLRLREGVEHLRCVRLSERGLMRWYAGCCNTPVCNGTAWAKLPFVGVLHMFVEPSARAALGPVRARIPARWGELPSDGVILRSIALLLGGWIRRAHRGSPLFDERSGEPVVVPTVLSPAERERLRDAVDG